MLFLILNYWAITLSLLVSCFQAYFVYLSFYNMFSSLSPYFGAFLQFWVLPLLDMDLIAHFLNSKAYLQILPSFIYLYILSVRLSFSLLISTYIVFAKFQLYLGSFVILTLFTVHPTILLHGLVRSYLLTINRSPSFGSIKIYFFISLF